MSTEKLIRWSGMLAMTSAAIALLFNVAVPVGLIPAAAEPPRQMLTLMLTIFALIGIYGYQHTRSGVLGLTGFVVAEISLLLNFALRFLFTFVAPILIAEYPEAVAAVDRGPYGAAFMTTLLLYVIGYVLFGAATYRARMLPRGAAILLIAGAIASYVLMMIPINIGAILMNIGFAWIGWTLWSGTPSRIAVSEAQPAT